MTFDPISQDPPIVDKDYPATMLEVVLDSHGAMLNGIMYIAQGAGPHPTILLLHGFPGHERNLDLAQIFRRAGYNAMVFHYRGAWGSEGDFRFSHVLEDAENAIHFLRDPQTAEKYRVDTEQIIAIGHSMGGWITLHLAGKGLVNRAASIAGVNLGLWGEMVADDPKSREYSLQFFEASVKPLNGVTGAMLVDEVVDHMDDFDVMQYATIFSQLELCLVAGERDDGVPASLHHTPLVTLLEKKGAQKLTHIIMDADHGFNDKRLTLARFLLDWLEK